MGRLRNVKLCLFVIWSFIYVVESGSVQQYTELKNGETLQGTNGQQMKASSSIECSRK